MTQLPLPALSPARLELVLVQHHLEGLYSYFYPEKTTPSCLLRYKQQWIHNQILLSEVERLGKIAERHQLKAVILKGIDLLLNLYDDNGMRFMSDIDLLVEEKDLPLWEKILSEESFHPLSVSDFGGTIHKKDWRKMSGEVEVNLEIHTRLFYHLDEKNDQWNTGPSRLPGLLQLKREDLFVHLAGHLAFQHTFSRLNWTLDLFYFYQKWGDRLNWQHVYRIAQEKKLVRSVQMALWILQTHFSVSLSAEVSRLFDVQKNSWWKKWLTMNFLLFPQKYFIKYVLIKHATKDSFSEALKYDLHWFYRMIKK